MACANIFDAFKQRAEALQDTIYRRATFQSLMLNAVDRGQYPQGQGLTQTVFEMGNVYPTTDERSWDSYTLATGSNAGACANNFIDYDVGYNELTYSPKRMQLRGPLLCKDEAYFSAFSGQFLTGYVEELGKLVDHELGNHLLTDYMNFTPKAVVTSAFPITAVGAPFTALPAAAGDLSQEALDKAAVHLIQKRATNPDSNGFITMANGGPVFTVSLGMEASQAITHANSDFRQDLRDANPSELFTRLGANTAIKGWRHVINLTPPRYTFSGGTYTRVATYVQVSGTKGNVYELNPSYISAASAPYEAAVVLNPAVMKWEWVSPPSKVGSVQFENSNYMGEWKFITGPEACATDGSGVDPFHKYGRHIGELAGASKPGANREAGLVILFKRCYGGSITPTSCT